ncbi:MAG: hypothetical protein AAFV19_00470 [Pseudomonadota bacterium]
MRIVHFLLHVPKCAGTTVEAHFRKHLGARFMIAPRWESPMRNFIGNRYPGLSPQAMADIAVVSGHSVSANMEALFPGAEIRASVLLRDPLGHLLSFYNYRWTRYADGQGPEPPSFDDWYDAQRRNQISRFLLNRYFGQAVPALYRLSSQGRLRFLEARLAQFFYVGSYKHVGEMCAEISRELGIPDTVESENVTQSRKVSKEDLPSSLREQIAHENALDQCLYDRWKDRKWSGAPSGEAPPLAALDQLGYVLGDIATGLRKKIIQG